MRLGGCVEESSRGTGGRARKGVSALKALERNAEAVWRVFVSTDQFAIPETIDARRGIGEV
jgi:hypothetical protein